MLLKNNNWSNSYRDITLFFTILFFTIKCALISIKYVIKFGTKTCWNLSFSTCYCRHSILHPWFNQGRWLVWPSMYKKKKSNSCITCIILFLHHMHHFVLASNASICSYIVSINSFIAYHKNDLEILMVATMFLVFKLDHWIERYCMIKFARSICIVSR